MTHSVVVYHVHNNLICQSYSAPLQDDSTPTSSCTYTHSPHRSISLPIETYSNDTAPKDYILQEEEWHLSSLLQEDYTVAENQLPERGYNYTGDQLALESCTSVTPCSLPAVARQITTPLKRERWRERLRHHPDQLFAQYLINGISNGFRLGY